MDAPKTSGSGLQDGLVVDNSDHAAVASTDSYTAQGAAASPAGGHDISALFNILKTATPPPGLVQPVNDNGPVHSVTRPAAEEEFFYANAEGAEQGPVN